MFHESATEDEQFNEEKSILLQTLERLDSAALAAAPEPEPGSLLPQAVASPCNECHPS